METLKYLEYCTHLAFLTIYQGRGRDFKSSYKCVRQTFGSELLCRHRLSLSKQPASPSVSPPCGNLLLLFKERRGQRGGPGEGRARYVQQTVEPGRSMSRIVSLYKSVSDNSSWPSACCWLFAHTHFTHSWGRHTFHALPGEPTDGHNGVALPSGEYRLYLTHSLQVALHTFKASMAAKVSNGS